MYVSALVSKKLPANKPPWEFRVVSQSVDCSSTDTIIILRIHQCLADGMTLIKILCTKLVDTRASYTALRVGRTFRMYVEVVIYVCNIFNFYRVSNFLFNFLSQSHFKFSYYLRLVQAFCIGPAMIIYKMIQAYKNSKNLPREEADEQLCSVNWSTSISMSKVDKIKQVTRSSYNCVFLSAVTGGLRYVLQNSGIKHPPDLKVIFTCLMLLPTAFIIDIV